MQVGRCPAVEWEMKLLARHQVVMPHRYEFWRNGITWGFLNPSERSQVLNIEMLTSASLVCERPSFVSASVASRTELLVQKERQMARPVDGTGWNWAKVPQYHLPAGWVACVLHLSVCEFVERIAGKMTWHDSDYKGRLNETLKEKRTLPDWPLC